MCLPNEVIIRVHVNGCDAKQYLNIVPVSDKCVKSILSLKGLTNKMSRFVLIDAAHVLFLFVVVKKRKVVSMLESIANNYSVSLCES